jgi:hypothetical protein
MIDTAMGARFDVPKVSPASVVSQSLDGAVTGAYEVLADDGTRMVKGLLSRPAEDLAEATAQAMAAVFS